MRVVRWTWLVSLLVLLLFVALHSGTCATGVAAAAVGAVIGIDLGTTNSRYTNSLYLHSCQNVWFLIPVFVCRAVANRVGVFKDGIPRIIPNERGNRATPSYVAFTDEGQRLVGDLAKSHATTNPQNTLFGMKKFIGRSWDEMISSTTAEYLDRKSVV